MSVRPFIISALLATTSVIDNSISMSGDKTSSKTLNNSASTVHPVIKFQNPDRDSEFVSEYSKQVIKDAMLSAGLQKIIITSTKRDLSTTINAIYNNLVEKKPAKRSQAGTRVQEEGKKLLDEGVLKKDKIIKKMLEKAGEAGPGNISKHHGDYNTLQVIDISDNEMSTEKKQKFLDALRSNKPTIIRKIGHPLNERKSGEFYDGCFHVEIIQPKDREE